MIIVKYDKNTDIFQLTELCTELMKKGNEVIAIPDSVELMMEASAECLIAIQEKLAVALDKIKEERPEEYQTAYDNMYVHLRDKQWQKAIEKVMNIK